MLLGTCRARPYPNGQGGASPGLYSWARPWHWPRPWALTLGAVLIDTRAISLWLQSGLGLGLQLRLDPELESESDPESESESESAWHDCIPGECLRCPDDLHTQWAECSSTTTFQAGSYGFTGRVSCMRGRSALGSQMQTRAGARVRVRAMVRGIVRGD